MSSAECHQIRDEPLDDLLLALEVRRASAVVHVDTPEGAAQLSVSRGTLREAMYGEKHGSDAVRAVLGAKVGTYRLDWMSEKPSFSGTLFHPSAGKEVTDFAPQSGVSVRSFLEHKLDGVDAPLMVQRLKTTGRGLSPEMQDSVVALQILSELRQPRSGLELMQRCLARPTEVLRVLRELLQEGCVRSLSALPPSSEDKPIRLVASRRVLLTDHPQPGKPLSDHRALDDAELDDPLPQVPSVARIGSVPLGKITKTRKASEGFHKTLVGQALPGGLSRGRALGQGSLSSGPNPTDPATVAPAILGRRGMNPSERSLAGSSAYSDTQGEFRSVASPTRMHQSLGRTAISGTIPDVLRQTRQGGTLDGDDFRVTLMGGTGSVRPELVSEPPLPSTRFEPETLHQLELLNEAISGAEQAHQPGIRQIDPIEIGLRAAPKTPAAAQEYSAERSPDSGLPRVGRYEVLARLRSGGMGSVYLCRLSGSAGFERLFAMKVLKAEGQAQMGPLEDFFREARVLASLHHPNVVGIVDVGTPQEPYLVLDYVEGDSLHELLKATLDERNPALVIPILLDALCGLQAAHQAKDNDGNLLHLIHGDVTPHNLLVGVDGACRVADFGIARTGDPAQIAGIARGKPGYVAPEVLLQAQVDQRSDLFSMGVVLYSALAGVEPFTGEDAEETMRNVLEKPIAPPSSVGLRPPPCFDFVVMKALERAPEDRFSSAEEMMVQLRRVAARQEMLASPSEVSSWVAEGLKPLLAARREAVGKRNRRISVTELTPSSERALASGRSPFQQSASVVSGPPSSVSWAERTILLADGPVLNTHRRRDVLLSVAVVGAILLLLLLARPQLAAGLLGDEEAATARPPHPKGNAPAAGQKEAEARKKHSTEGIILPDIEPASSKD